MEAKIKSARIAKFLSCIFGILSTTSTYADVAKLRAVAFEHLNPQDEVHGPGDFNGDGVHEVLIRDTSDGSLFIGQIDTVEGTSIIARYPVGGLGPNTEVVGLVDLDGDHSVDVILFNPEKDSYDVGYLSGQNSTLIRRTLLGPAFGLKFRASGHIDSDPYVDLVFSENHSQNHVYGHVRNGTLTQLKNFKGPRGSQLLGLRDLNGDGFTDSLWHDPVLGHYNARMRQSSGSHRDIRLANNSNFGSRFLGFGDFDNDGYTEIFWETRMDSGFEHGPWGSHRYYSLSSIYSTIEDEDYSEDIVRTLIEMTGSEANLNDYLFGSISDVDRDGKPEVILNKKP